MSSNIVVKRSHRSHLSKPHRGERVGSWFAIEQVHGADRFDSEPLHYLNNHFFRVCFYFTTARSLIVGSHVII